MSLEERMAADTGPVLVTQADVAKGESRQTPEQGGHMTRTLDDALALVRQDLPGWAYDLLSKAAVNKEAPPVNGEGTWLNNVEVESFGELAKWALERGPVRVAADSEALAKGAGVLAEGEGQLRSATREGFDAAGSHGVVVVSEDGATCCLKAERAYDEVGLVVPSAGPRRPLVAFVGNHPTHLDAARGEPFCGPLGRVLQDEYLGPLGLSKSQVLLTHALPVAGEVAPGTMGQWVGWVRKELERYRPAIVVALGKEAKAALGPTAQFVLPHPAAVSRRGDSGEVVRKVRAIRERLAAITTFDATVAIAKAVAPKQITYSAALDPYQWDTHDDWIPARDVEATAHDYLTKSRVVGLQHQGAADADVVESWLVHYPSPEDYQKAMNDEPHRAYSMKFGNMRVHSGTWMLGIRANDSKLWAAIEKGDYTAYSIGGSGIRTAVDKKTAMPKVEFIEIG